MSTAQNIPLGFSDLTMDECVLIALFRRWCSIGPTRAIAEHQLACLLQADSIHPALDSLFRLFDEIPCIAPFEDGETDLLSEDEEALLNLLSDRHHPDKDRAIVKQCRRDIKNSEIQLRPASAIPRSGRDEILLRAAESYQTVYGVLL